MQIAPWLGLVPGNDGQTQQILSEDGKSPVISLFKSATNAVISHPGCLSSSSFLTLSKQAEAADSFYMNNIHTGSILDYTLAFMSAALDTVRDKWNATPKTGLIDITTSREFYRIYSGLQFFKLSKAIWMGICIRPTGTAKRKHGRIGSPKRFEVRFSVASNKFVNESPDTVRMKADPSQSAAFYEQRNFDLRCRRETGTGRQTIEPSPGAIEYQTADEIIRRTLSEFVVFCGEPFEESTSNQEHFGDSVAWGGCTITYLLGQQLHFELFDFIYQLLNVAEVENVATAHSITAEKAKPTHYGQVAAPLPI
eukprot:Gb_18362 [translate_table: standard]